MLTLKQFLAYCLRNNIQTVRYTSVYNALADYGDHKITFLSTIIRKEESHQWCIDEIFESYQSPLDFYNWYVNIDKHNVCDISYAVRRHMRSKCALCAIFNDDFLPF